MIEWFERFLDEHPTFTALMFLAVALGLMAVGVLAINSP